MTGSICLLCWIFHLVLEGTPSNLNLCIIAFLMNTMSSSSTSSTSNKACSRLKLFHSTPHRSSTLLFISPLSCLLQLSSRIDQHLSSAPRQFAPAGAYDGTLTTPVRRCHRRASPVACGPAWRTRCAACWSGSRTRAGSTWAGPWGTTSSVSGGSGVLPGPPDESEMEGEAGRLRAKGRVLWGDKGMTGSFLSSRWHRSRGEPPAQHNRWLWDSMEIHLDG